MPDDRTDAVRHAHGDCPAERLGHSAPVGATPRRGWSGLTRDLVRSGSGGRVSGRWRLSPRRFRSRGADQPGRSSHALLSPSAWPGSCGGTGFGYPGVNPQIPLYIFIFLAALGVDYSIFLSARVRGGKPPSRHPPGHASRPYLDWRRHHQRRGDPRRRLRRARPAAVRLCHRSRPGHRHRRPPPHLPCPQHPRARPPSSPSATASGGPAPTVPTAAPHDSGGAGIHGRSQRS